MAGSYVASPLGTHSCLVGICFVMEGLAVLCSILLGFLCTRGVTRRALSANKERFCVLWMVGERERGELGRKHVTALDFEDLTSILPKNSNLFLHSILVLPTILSSNKMYSVEEVMNLTVSDIPPE